MKIEKRIPIALLAGCLIAFSETQTSAQEVLAGPILNEANGHFYYLLSQATWEDSEAAAIRLGGQLVTISDAAENNWVFDTFNGFGGGNLSLWIGFTDRAQEGVFVWSSGEPVTFTGWGAGEPNNGAGGPVEHYAYIQGFNSGQPTLPPRSWNDIPNVSGPNGVVEVTTPRLTITIPEPGKVTISWVPLLPGFVLQQNAGFAPGDWADVTGAISSPATLDATEAARFFRLIKR